MINFEKMTLKAQEAVESAVEAARRSRNQEIGVEHLIAGMLSIQESVAVSILEKIGADAGSLIKDVEAIIARKPKVEGGSSQEYFSKEARETLDAAFREAAALQDEYMSVEHLLIAVAELNRKGELG